MGERILHRFKTRKAASLLAYLATFAGPHNRGQLSTLLWPETNTTSGLSRLSDAIYTLTGELQDRTFSAPKLFHKDRFSVGLNPEAVEIDLIEFRSALRRANESDNYLHKIEHLHRAALLNQGELLPDFYEEWIPLEQARLNEAYSQSLSSLVSILNDQKEIESALVFAGRCARIDLFNEKACRENMRLHAAAGDPSAALQQYGALFHNLERLLGVSPSKATRILMEEIKGSI